MPNRHTTAAVLLLLTPLLAGCGDATDVDDRHDAQIARLTAAVDGLAASNEALSNEVRRQGRQLSGLSSDVAATRSAILGAASASRGEAGEASEDEVLEPNADGAGAAGIDPSLDPAAALEEGLADERVVDALLATDAGREVIQKAAAKEMAKREEQDRRTYVSYAIGVFARDAGLDEHQTRDLQRIWKESLDGGVKLRQQFAAVRTLPEDEQPEAREKAMELMRDLGRRREQEVSKVLTQEQLERYEKTEDDIVASLHGGARRPANPAPAQPGQRED